MIPADDTNPPTGTEAVTDAGSAASDFDAMQDLAGQAISRLLDDGAGSGLLLTGRTANPPDCSSDNNAKPDRHSGRLHGAVPTRAASGSPDARLHLHWELHIDGHYLGIGLSAADTRAVYTALFADAGATQK